MDHSQQHDSSFEVVDDESVNAGVRGLCVEIPLDTIRRAVSVAELSNRNFDNVEIGVEQLAQLAQHMNTLVECSRMLSAGVSQGASASGMKTTSDADKDEAASAAESQSSEVVYVIPDMDVVEMQIEELTQEAANASPVVTQDATAPEEVCVGASVSKQSCDGASASERVSEGAVASKKKMTHPEAKCQGATASGNLTVTAGRGDESRSVACHGATASGSQRHAAVKRVQTEDKKPAKKGKYHTCKLCPDGFFTSTPVRRHAVRAHLPWFIAPETACWTCQMQCGSANLLNRHLADTKTEMDDGEIQMHATFSSGRVLEWCELSHGFLQQMADRVTGSGVEALAQWAATNISYKEKIGLHAFDRELLQMLSTFLGDKPEVAALVGWRTAYEMLQCVPSDCLHTVDGCARATAPGGKVWRNEDLLPRVRNMYDAHSHLDRWAATMRPSEARDKLEGFRYNTVTSYCFQRQWNEARKQEWWPSKSLGPLKQAFGLHPTEAAKGLSPDGWADLKTLVKRRECVAVGEIGLDYTRVRDHKGRTQQRDMLEKLCRLADTEKKPVVIHCRGGPDTFDDCTRIMKEHLSRSTKVYWHHYSGTDVQARDIENMFPEVVFGVSPVILAEQRDDTLERFIRSTALERLLVESDSPMIGERRSGNHPWVVENVLRRVAKLRSVPVPMMKRLVETGYRRLFRLSQ